jgi:hypothetical protein
LSTIRFYGFLCHQPIHSGRRAVAATESSERRHFAAEDAENAEAGLFAAEVAESAETDSIAMQGSQKGESVSQKPSLFAREGQSAHAVDQAPGIKVD